VTSLRILGCRLDPIDSAEATRRILAFVREGGGAQIVTLGTEMVVYAQRDAHFRSVVNACALSLCDTVGLLMVARMRGATLRERVTGVELVERLCSAAALEGASVYFLGGAEGVAAQAGAVLQARYSGLRVAGTCSGYFADDQTPAIVQAIANSGARLLFVGLGSPRQEFWLAEHLRETRCGAAVGVGGSFDVIAGRVERAPHSLRRLGLEWLYRLGKEPWRWRRQLALPRFVWLVALEQLGIGRTRESSMRS